MFADEADNAGVLAALVNAVPGHVMSWTIDTHHYASEHERVTRASHAERLAALQGYRYGGELGADVLPAGPVYLVPSDTVVGCDVAQSMGIRQESDFFGGVVPQAFVATKAISHGLYRDNASAPSGWMPAFASRIGDCVLKGYTAFSEGDARRAGRTLLLGGSVRVKPVRATGGCGQSVVKDGASLDRELGRLAHIDSDGVVLERNLRSPRTLSIGQVTVGGQCVSYYGQQRLTRNHAGDAVYGGSDLTVVRGDMLALRAMPLTPMLRLAVDQARAYHETVIESFPGFMASRINYDVAQGHNDAGRWCSGVLEQSWRLGGASGAEIAALEVLREQPDRKLVRASCFEVFGEVTLPPGARVYYSGTDPAVGRLTKYSFVEPHADAT
jgi:hypothetical protein